MTIATLILAFIAVPAPETARGPAILDFTASWCGPCKQLRPEIEALRNKNYPIRTIDVDEQPELAKRYEISSVPALIIIDPDGRPLARSGPKKAAELARLYIEATRDLAPAEEDEPQPKIAEDRPSSQEIRPANDEPRAVAPGNPRPWETVVRITVHSNGSLGLGSGTIVHSTPEESIILTCAHIFAMGKGQQPPPSKFPLKVTVELFDGKLGGAGGQTLTPASPHIPAEVIDYDHDRDVGLIRIRPGRILPASPVVPQHWSPQARMRMYTVGCSHGKDATAWNTVITDPQFAGLGGKREYEAIQCKFSPKQGRSGGGLYTEDGYVAGVCNFAFDPRVGLGLYASPRSIYQLLDRNQLQVCYQPPRSRPGTMLASNPATRPSNSGSGSNSESGLESAEADVVRAQSPDAQGPRASTPGRDLAEAPRVTLIPMPSPDVFGAPPLPEPPPGDNSRHEQIPSYTSGSESRPEPGTHRSWRALPTASADGLGAGIRTSVVSEAPVTTELKRAPTPNDRLLPEPPTEDDQSRSRPEPTSDQRPAPRSGLWQTTGRQG
ncbi:trypsin-like peptidase domain-containing protein [soil metagenome]